MGFTSSSGDKRGISSVCQVTRHSQLPDPNQQLETTEHNCNQRVGWRMQFYSNSKYQHWNLITSHLCFLFLSPCTHSLCS